MATVYLGLGSNLGDRKQNCLEAMDILESRGLKITKKSSMYETEPWGLEDQPSFINMAIEAETSMRPRALLSLLKKVEREMGRGPSVRWGPRVIDIDILFYDDLKVDEDRLVIPHPLMHERLFVLEPLSEIAADRVHPVLGRTVKELLRTCGKGSSVSRREKRPRK